MSLIFVNKDGTEIVMKIKQFENRMLFEKRVSVGSILGFGNVTYGSLL